MAVCFVVGLLYGGPDTSEHGLVRSNTHSRACSESVVKSTTKDGVLIIESPWVRCQVAIPVGPGQGWQDFVWLLGRPVAFIGGEPAEVILTKGHQHV